MSASVISRSRSVTSPFVKRASGRRPRSMTTSMSCAGSVSAWTASTTSGGMAPRSRSRSSIDSRRWNAPRSVTSSPVIGSTYCRNESGFRDPDHGFLHQEGDRDQARKPSFLEAAIDRRFVGANGRQHPGVGAASASRYAGSYDSQPKVHERSDLGAGFGEDLEVVGLFLLGDAHLEQRPEFAASIAGYGLHVCLHVGEAQDGGQAGARHAGAGALALPIGQPVRLQSDHRLRRDRSVETSQRQRVEGLARPYAGVSGLFVRPRPWKRLPWSPEQEVLLTVASKTRLHEQLYVALAIGACNVKADRAALGSVAEEVLDHPETRVAGVARADRVELHDRHLVARGVALHPQQPRNPPLVFVDEEQVVGTESAERQTEQAEDANPRTADRQAQRTGCLLYTSP